jgi:hypothetical protein
MLGDGEKDVKIAQPDATADPLRPVHADPLAKKLQTCFKNELPDYSGEDQTCNRDSRATNKRAR